MEEYTKDLKHLIKLQRQRPAFARTISWEFSHSEGGGHRKSKGKQKTRESLQDGASGSVQDDDDAVDDDTVEGIADSLNRTSRQHRLSTVESVGDSESSDESEYYSALEDEIDESVVTDDTFETLDSLGDSVTDTVERLDLDEVDNDNDSAMVASESSKIFVSDTGRRRRPSKKQKRKRNREFRVTFANEIMTLGNIFDVTEDIDAAVSEMTEGGSNMCINRQVPTLVQLCMAATSRPKKVEPKEKVGLPVGMRRLVSGWNKKQSLLRKQLSWLQNHLLPLSDTKENFFLTCAISVNKTGADRFLFIYPTRSVWNAIPFPQDQSWNENDNIYSSGKAASFLGAFSLNSKDQQDGIHWQYNNFCSYEVLRPLCNLSALASAIDLMLPAYITERSLGGRNVTEQELFSKGFKTMIIRVKLALKARFPRMVEELLDRALPYVMWARGNVTMATEMFHSLISTEKRVRIQAMYLSEIARMNSEFDELETAVKFYRLAAERAIGKPKYTDKDIQEVTEQTQVLVASLHDNGVPTPEKTRQSSSYWNGALNLPNQRLATAVMAVESFLCFHAAHWTDCSWLDEALRKISSVERTHQYLKYHASMILALQGKDNESRYRYKESLNGSSVSPGAALLRILSKNRIRNAWQPLLDIVANNKTPLKPLKVIWRRQLGAPQLCASEQPEEAQISTSLLNLRINEDGYVAGDIQNILPPQRDICLDPYTGSSVITHVPSVTATMLTPELKTMSEYHFEELHMPTPQLLYSDDGGTTVYIMKPGLEPCTKYASQQANVSEPFVLHWQNTAGQKAKINVIQAIKNALKERVLADINTRKNWDEDKKTKMAELVQIFCDNNRCFDVYSVERVHNDRVKQDRKDNKKKVTPKRNKKSFLKNAKPLRVRWDAKPYIYGHSILLQLQDHLNVRYYMFINTKDKESFLKYQVKPNSSNETLGENYSIKSLPQPGEFCVTYIKGQVQIYNENGVVVDTLLDVKDPDHLPSPCIIGPYIYLITKDRLSVLKHLIGVSEPEDEEDRQLERNNNTAWAFAEYWSLLPVTENKQVLKMRIVGRLVGNTGSFLMIHTSVGLCFMDPETFNLLPVTMETKSPSPYQQSEDHKMLLCNVDKIKLRAEKTYTIEGGQVTKLALAIDNSILVFEINTSLPQGETKVPSTEIKLIMSVALPGFAVEACFVGKEVGILIAVTMYAKGAQFYRQNLFYFKLDGHCYGLLPCLGRGSRSFHPVFLRGGEGQTGWHVYMRDGHNGIICVKLQDAAL